MPSTDRRETRFATSSWVLGFGVDEKREGVADAFDERRGVVERMGD